MHIKFEKIKIKNKKKQRSQWDGSVGKALATSSGLEFSLQDSHVGRRNPTPTSCLLTSAPIPWPSSSLTRALTPSLTHNKNVLKIIEKLHLPEIISLTHK